MVDFLTRPEQGAPQPNKKDSVSNTASTVTESLTPSSSVNDLTINTTSETEAPKKKKGVAFSEDIIGRPIIDLTVHIGKWWENVLANRSWEWTKKDEDPQALREFAATLAKGIEVEISKPGLLGYHQRRTGYLITEDQGESISWMHKDGSETHHVPCMMLRTARRRKARDALVLSYRHTFHSHKVHKVVFSFPQDGTLPFKVFCDGMAMLVDCQSQIKKEESQKPPISNV